MRASDLLSIHRISIHTESQPEHCTVNSMTYMLQLQPGASCTLNCSIVLKNFENIFIDFKEGSEYRLMNGASNSPCLPHADGLMQCSSTIVINEDSQYSHIHCMFSVDGVHFYSQLLTVRGKL